MALGTGYDIILTDQFMWCQTMCFLVGLVWDILQRILSPEQFSLPFLDEFWSIFR